jgi:hypothetical protein
MDKIEDGGPAYPGGLFETQHGGSNDRAPYYPGMSLRDAFAMAALTGMLDYSGASTYETEHKYAKIAAEAAYVYADAMLKARSTKEGE